MEEWLVTTYQALEPYQDAFIQFQSTLPQILTTPLYIPLKFCKELQELSIKSKLKNSLKFQKFMLTMQL